MNSEVKTGQSEGKTDRKTLAVNRKARHNFEIIETLECGIELKGTEVKSIRGGRFSFADSYGWIENDQLWLVGFHVSTYSFGNRHNHEPDRRRRLLIHRSELKRLKRRVLEKGLTLVPMRTYLKGGLVKIELGLGRGKKLYDKRAAIKSRDMKRDADRELRNRF
jgi:SsrA-binding protein